MRPVAEPAAMDPERWRRAFDIFHAAMARDAGERAAFLADACLGDESMRRAVEQLVSAHESAGDFLEVPAAVGLLAGDDHRSAARTAAAVPRGRVRRNRTIHGRADPRRRRHGHRLRGARSRSRSDRRAEDAAARQPGRRLSPQAGVPQPRRCRPSQSGVSLRADRRGHRTASSRWSSCSGVNLVEYVRGSSEAPGSLRRRPRQARVSSAGGRTLGAASPRQAPSRHQAVQRAGHAGRARGHSRLRPDRRCGAGTWWRDRADRAAGTPAYISPEDISGARATEASDWYSVGITLYEALTGRVPFEGPFEEQLRHKTQCRSSGPVADRGGRPRRAQRDLHAT